MVRRDDNAKVGLTLRLGEQLRVRLEAASKRSFTSLNNEVISRLEASFDREALYQAILGKDPSAAMLFAMHRAIGRVLRVAKNTGLDEVEARREMKAAIDVVAGIYLWTGEDIPSDPADTDSDSDNDGAAAGPEKPLHRLGRYSAYHPLAWEGDQFLEDVKDAMRLGGDGPVVIYDRWTGDGEQATDLVKAGHVTPERVGKLRDQVASGEIMTLEQIMARGMRGQDTGDGTDEHPSPVVPKQRRRAK